MARKKPRASGKREPKQPVPAEPARESADAPWRIRYAEEVLTKDVRGIGQAALVVARSTIEKKLKVDPEQYGARLHSPLHGLFKLKASHLRIAYHVEKPAREVWILMIGDRREIWAEDQPEILIRFNALRTDPGEEKA